MPHKVRMKTARYWHRLEDGRIRCDLCPHGCTLADGATGMCRVRQARDGALHALSYGHLTSVSMDPVEKKPLHHFHPGREILSIGGWGCNLACSFCQNWGISQKMEAVGAAIEPAEVVAMAEAQHSFGIAYTYNEPLVGLEYVLDCARLARERGLKNVLVTNGYAMPEPAAEALSVTDAINLDIKSMDPSFYRSLCKGTLEPVLNFARQAVAAGCRIEVTCLLIPGHNEDPDQVARLAAWMKDNLGVAVPLHLSAYFPRYRMDVQPTGAGVLEAAYRRAREVLPYVYVGNMPGTGWSDTYCPNCGSVLVRRSGYDVVLDGIANERCGQCARPVDLVLA
jgi:pyruvate formate lyase activating enzyme